MSSKTCLATRIDFDSEALKRDLNVLAELPRINEQYDEFSFGTWINHSLWNKSGEWQDTQFADLDSPPIKTEIAEKMSYLSEFIEDTFDLDHMTMARVRNLIDGGVIPHIDFLELSENKYGYVRILIPLESCIDSYHTEENFGVFRMRKGDVWILESQVPHAAFNLGGDNRRILSIDFHYTDEKEPHWSRIFKDQSIINTDIDPAMVARPELQESDLEEYLESLAAEFTHIFAAEQILRKLSVLQLRFESPVSDVYENLILVAKKTGNAELIEYARKMKTFYIGKRKMDERFLLREDLLATA